MFRRYEVAAAHHKRRTKRDLGRPNNDRPDLKQSGLGRGVRAAKSCRGPLSLEAGWRIESDSVKQRNPDTTRDGCCEWPCTLAYCSYFFLLSEGGGECPPMCDSPSREYLCI